jgi:hypothetical protein
MINQTALQKALDDLEDYKETEDVDSLALVEEFLNSLTEQPVADTGKPRYIIHDNVDGEPSGYELVDTDATPHCTFAVGLREEFAVEITRRLNEGDKARRALLHAVNTFNEVGFDTDEAISGADTVDVVCQLYPILKAALQ